MSRKSNPRYIVLSGGIGGAKFALGMSHVVPGENLTVIANTGDDFEHFGLCISPDLDTLMYTIGGLADEETGWGQRDETWNFMKALEALGEETWFNLGDRDLATHVVRTQRLAAGEGLEEITRDLCTKLGIAASILPMTEESVQTKVTTDEGRLDFQDYFVRRKCEPRVEEVEFAGAGSATAASGVVSALQDENLRAIFIAPSNPFLSVDPILAIKGIRDGLGRATAPVVAISPIVGGEAIKGPTAKMMREMGLEVSAAAVAAHYGDLIDGYILDDRDQDLLAAVAAIGVAATSTATIMSSLDDKISLARFALEFAEGVAKHAL